jgi:hypothetical protein
LAVAALVCGGLWVPAIQAQDKPSAEAEVPSLPSRTPTEVAPRVAPGPQRMNGLLRLEEQLRRSFQFFKPSNPGLEATPLPPPPRASAPVQSQRAKELLEQKKNWMYANPDGLTTPSTTEDLLNPPEYGAKGLNDKSRSSMQRLYQDLDQRNGALAKKRNGLTPEDPSGLRDQETDDANLPAGIRDNEKKLRKLLGFDNPSAALTPSRGTLSDILGLGDKSTAPTPEEVARKVYLDEFNAWLNRSAATTPANNGLASVPGAADSTRQTVATAGAPATFAPFNPAGRPNNYDPSIGMVNPTIATSTPQDITAKVLNQWNPYYVPPKVEPPKTQSPQPGFDVPRRKF